MILIGIGSNLTSPAGPPPQTVRAAVGAMARHGLAVRRCSSLWHTPPYPRSAQPWFTNAVVEVATPLSAAQLLQKLHDIERQFGRKRRIKWAARPLDLDLLDYHGTILGAEADGADHLSRPLILPHPALESRNFVLKPLYEIAPAWRHPVSGRRLTEILNSLPKAELGPENIKKGATFC